jgi:peroxisomal 3,2-trans-enoyl-CoA isomerase
VVYGINNDGLLHIKLNRPSKKNALLFPMSAKIGFLLNDANTNPNVKVVLLYGAGEYFSAGNDVTQFFSLTKEQVGDPTRFEMFANTFVDLKKPLYVYVKGFAVGMMVTLLAFADFIYCTDNAFFYTPFMTSNQSPEGLSTIMFPQIFGFRKANEMIYLEKKMKAQEALECGFVNGILDTKTAPKTDPIVQDIDNLPGLRKLLNTDTKTLLNAKNLIH